MTLVAGVDSSTQSCKVVIRDAASGALVRQGRAAHPDGTEVDPQVWWRALGEAIAQAGGIDDVSALSVGGQQHGMVALDEAGEVIRPALLWNDTRSAQAATDLIAEQGDGDPAAGAAWWARSTGLVPVASFTVTKLRWLRDHEPDAAARLAAVALPHDWLSWRLAGHGPGSGALGELYTDRSDASGTGYYSAASGQYLPDVLRLACGTVPVVPTVLGPHESRATTPAGVPIGPGAGDNAAASLGLGMGVGDVSLSIGTSGVVAAVSPDAVADPSGLVAGFADATGAFLPLACTLNGARILDQTAAVLGVDHAQFDALALSAAPGAGGLTMVPFFEGERTPNRPDATASLYGMRLANTTRENLARAAVEALCCLLADCLDAVTQLGVDVRRVLLIGGAARSEAVRRIMPGVLGRPIEVPPADEYVANGAARQAAWVAMGEQPTWDLGDVLTCEAPPQPSVRQRYAEVRDLV